MIKDLFRPRHLLDTWRDDFVRALRLRSAIVYGHRAWLRRVRS